MQSVLSIPFFKQSRLKGTLSVTTLHALRLTLLYAVILILIQSLSLVMRHIEGTLGNITTIEVDSGLNFILLFVAVAIYSGKETRYFAGQATGRVIIFLGAVGKIIAMSITLTLCTALINALIALVFALLSPGRSEGAFTVLYAVRDGYRVYGMEGYGMLLSKLPGSILGHILWLMQMGSMMYLFFCLFRRWRTATICVMIGGGILLMTLLFLPLISQVVLTAEQAESGNIGQLMTKIEEWLDTLLNVLIFIEERWPVIRAVTAVVCLPLSYLVMSRAKMPK